MADLFDYALKAGVFLLMISVLVAAHEWGHYIVARLCGMGVEEFAVGMFGRKPVFTFLRKRYRIPLPPDSDAQEGEVIDVTAGGHAIEGGGARRTGTVVRDPDGRLMIEEETIFNIRPWPIGGFVRIKGMAPDEHGNETKIPGGFYSRPAWQRFLALAAGPAASLVAGVAILFLGYTTLGVRVPDSVPRIHRMPEGAPAFVAGLRPNDVIVSVDGKPIRERGDFVAEVRGRGGERLIIGVDRAGKRLTFPVVPKWDAGKTPVIDAKGEFTGEMRRQAKVGIEFGSRLERLPAAKAWEEARTEPIRAFQAVVKIFANPVEAKDQVGGAISIVGATSNAVDDGIERVIEVSGLLSITVGVFNLLPIFPLDGGQMVLALVEMVRRRRPSIQFQHAIAVAGFVFLLVLIVSVNLLDVHRLFGGG